MVLDKLSSSLRETLKKITKGVFVDETLVNELVKDIQRALLQADVGVHLVLNLTKEIKRRALEEKEPKGISKKEFLIQIVYEELVKFLGKEKQEIQIKPNTKILFTGLYGAGKCVHKDSKILLSNGEIIKAQELYEQYKDKEENIDGGKIVELEQELYVPSFNKNTLKTENKRVTHLWKLEGKDLLKVYLDNGNDFSVRVTPEHPFFILRNGEVQQVRADQLTEDDFVATPTNCHIEGKTQDLFKKLKGLDLIVKGHHLELSKVNIMKDIMPNLLYPRNYCHLTQSLKRGIVPISLIEGQNKAISLKCKNATKFINFPLTLTEELAEFLGYVLGDGHLDKSYVEITTQDKVIIKRISLISQELFNLNTAITLDTRTKRTYHLRITSITLAEILNKVFLIPIGKKGKNLSVPKKIECSKKEVVAAFLRAYFDCDAYAAKNGREIELCSESEPMIREVAYLLTRFGIISSISRKYTKGIPYWRLFIRARYAEKYAKEIGFTIPYKLDRIKEYYFYGKIQGDGKQDNIPLGNELKELRQSLGFSIGEIQERVNSYGIYEKKGIISKDSLSGVIGAYGLNKVGNKVKILNYIENPLSKSLSDPFINGFTSILKTEKLIKTENHSYTLTKTAYSFLKNLNSRQETFERFKNLAVSDVCWLRINKIENIKYADYVYDLTVEDNHSFMADNIIVHNTTTIAKVARYYSVRGHKVAMVGLDTFRPGAMDQLEQLANQIKVPVFIDKKEKNPLKIYDHYEKELNHFDLVLVDTSGRDALNQELIEEIEALHKRIQPQESLLVISADIGQTAEKQAKQFHESCGITGIIITKMDGTAKAGGALSACAVTKAPVKFIGIGEKIQDLEVFNPEGFVGRLLGMGDLESLLEKVRESIDEEKAQDLGKKFLKGEFNFLDLYEQLQAMNNMGSLSKIMEMIPGLSTAKVPKEMIDVQEDKLKRWKYSLQSMTKSELEDPEILTRTRIERIAKGAGTNTKEVRDLLKQYRQTRKMVKLVSGKGDKGMEQLMKKFSRGNKIKL